MANNTNNWGAYAQVGTQIAGAAGNYISDIDKQRWFDEHKGDEVALQEDVSVGGQALKGAAAGAAMGSTIGPWGTVVGGVVGGAAGGITAAIQNKRIDEANDIAMKQHNADKLYMSSYDNNFNTNASNIPIMAEGGRINGFNNNILKEYTGGGTHEQNPNGGIPIDANGNPVSQSQKPVSALVESGEVSIDDFVFSNRIKNPVTKRTFAADAKKIKSKYGLRGDEKMSKESMKTELLGLMRFQESLSNKKNLADKLNSGTVEPQSKTNVPNEQQLPAEQQSQPQQQEAQVMAYGGKVKTEYGIIDTNYFKMPQDYYDNQNNDYDGVYGFSNSGDNPNKIDGTIDKSYIDRLGEGSVHNYPNASKDNYIPSPRIYPNESMLPTNRNSFIDRLGEGSVHNAPIQPETNGDISPRIRPNEPMIYNNEPIKQVPKPVDFNWEVPKDIKFSYPIEDDGVGLPPDVKSTKYKKVHPNFNEDYYKEAKLKQLPGLIGNSLAAMHQYMGANAENIHYNRLHPDLVDYTEERTKAKRDNIASGATSANIIGSNASSGGNAMTNLVASKVALNQNLNNILANSFMKEENQNVGIINNADAGNTQISNKEKEANLQERDAARSQRDQAVYRGADVYSSYLRDARAEANQSEAMQMMGDENYKFEHFMGSNNRVRVNYDSTTGIRYAVDDNGRIIYEDPKTGKPMSQKKYLEYRQKILDKNN